MRGGGRWWLLLFLFLFLFPPKGAIYAVVAFSGRAIPKNKPKK